MANKTRKPVGTVKALINKANKALERLRADSGWLGWPALLDYVREEHDPQQPSEGMTVEESLEGYEGMTYAQISVAVDADDEDEGGMGEQGFFPEEPEQDDYYTGG